MEKKACCLYAVKSHYLLCIKLSQALIPKIGDLGATAMPNHTDSLPCIVWEERSLFKTRG